MITLHFENDEFCIKRWEAWDNHDTDADPSHFSMISWILRVEYLKFSALVKCEAELSLAECVFPPVFYKHISTPLFVSENTADAYQVPANFNIYAIVY